MCPRAPSAHGCAPWARCSPPTWTTPPSRRGCCSPCGPRTPPRRRPPRCPGQRRRATRRRCPAALLGPEDASRWAAALLAPLGPRLRIALRCWLGHRGRTAPAAAELALHRTTLTTWLAECAQVLDLDLSSVTVRAELHLAVETVATPADAPAALPRRGGRTYGRPRG
ncbi:helix-turn-helix domain-containing protein [Streptomyces sp. PmtG]